MATSITVLQGSDGITTANSMAKINANFDSLLDNKVETDTLDTDTTLAANSDSKIATQKAVKAYVDSGGNQNASETTRGIVEEATDAEVTAGTATGSTGAKLFVTPAKLKTRTDVLVVNASTTAAGIVEEATQAQVDAATATGETGARLFVNPSTMAFRGLFKNGNTTKDLSSSSTTQTIAHGLGVIPKRVRLTGVVCDTGNNSGSYTVTTYNGTTQSSVNLFIDGSNNDPASGSSFRLQSEGASDNAYQTGVVTFDATNISIAWTKSGLAAGTADIIWEAEA